MYKTDENTVNSRQLVDDARTDVRLEDINDGGTMITTMVPGAGCNCRPGQLT